MTNQEKFNYFYRMTFTGRKITRKSIPLTDSIDVHYRLWEIYESRRDGSNKHMIKEMFADLATDFHLHTHVFNESH